MPQIFKQLLTLRSPLCNFCLLFVIDFSSAELYKHPFVISTVLDHSLKGLDFGRSQAECIWSRAQISCPAVCAASYNTAIIYCYAKRFKADNTQSATLKFLKMDRPRIEASRNDFNVYISAAIFDDDNADVLKWWALSKDSCRSMTICMHSCNVGIIRASFLGKGPIDYATSFEPAAWYCRKSCSS